MTRVVAGGDKYLLVGETLELGIAGAGRGYGYRYSYTLQFAPCPAAAEAKGRPGSAGKPTASDARSNTGTPLSLPSGARGGGGCSSGLSSGGGDDSGPKRRLEGLFADADPGVEVVRPPRPEPIDVEAAAAAAAAASASVAPTATKRRRRDGSRVGSASRLTPFNPVGVVDLCDADDLSVSAGKSRDQPVDLCDSDGEDAADRPAAPPGAPAAPIVPRHSGSGGGGGGGDSSSAGGIANKVPRPDNLQPTQEPPPVRITPAVSPAGLSLVRETRPTTIENDNEELAPALPPLHPRPSSEQKDRRRESLPPEVKPRGCEKEKEKEKGKNPATSAPSVVPPHDATGVAVLGPRVEKSEPTAKALTRMHDFLRHSLRIFMKNHAEATVPAVHEFLACGTAPPSTLCDTVVFTLLKSKDTEK